MNNKFLQLAKELSQMSTHSDHKHGCVIVYKNRVIGKGYNKASTHPKSTHRFNNLHAEMAALFSIKNDYNYLPRKCIMYVYRQHKNGSPALSKPCPSCTKLIKLNRLSTVVYTTEDGWVVENYG